MLLLAGQGVARRNSLAVGADGQRNMAHGRLCCLVGHDDGSLAAHRRNTRLADDRTGQVEGRRSGRGGRSFICAVEVPGEQGARRRDDDDDCGADGGAVTGYSDAPSGLQQHHHHAVC